MQKLLRLYTPILFSLVWLLLPQATFASCPTLTAYLAPGVTHAEVTTLKKFLAQQGLLSDVAYTTYFGSLSEAAVKEWQRRNGIEPTGTVGPKTRAALGQCGSRVVPSTQSFSTTNTPTASCEITTTLSRGMKGTDVTRLQSFLVSQQLLSSDSATGFYGAMTEAAVKQFQCKDMNLCSGTPQTTGYGMVGKMTRTAILSECKMSTVGVPPSSSTVVSSNPSPAPASHTTTPAPTPLPASPAPITPAPTTVTTVACTPLASETRASACSPGQIGSATHTRTSSCAVGATTPTWSAWATTTHTCAYPTTFTLKEYWPNPPAGMAYIKEYDAGLASKYIHTADGFLVKQDYYINTPNELIDEWGIRITAAGDVLETYDKFPDKTYYYLPGKEINWGRALSIGETLGDSVQMDMSRTTGIGPTSPSQYGYNTITLVKHHPSIQLQGVTHQNVLEISLFQSFCITNECTVPVTGYYYVSLQYYFAYGKGIIKTIFKDINGAADSGAHELTRECVVPEAATNCGA